MKTKQSIDERRTHDRLPFQVKYGVVPIPKSSKLGRIIDISRGGFAFRYFDSNALLDKVFELDILFEDDDFSLEKIPCRVIDDRSIADNQIGKPSNMRRCSVKFGKLMPHQISQLEYFIHENMAGEVFINLHANETYDQ